MLFWHRRIWDLPSPLADKISALRTIPIAGATQCQVCSSRPDWWDSDRRAFVGKCGFAIFLRAIRISANSSGVSCLGPADWADNRAAPESALHNKDTAVSSVVCPAEGMLRPTRMSACCWNRHPELRSWRLSLLRRFLLVGVLLLVPKDTKNLL
jgi:hypothetical protein